MSRNLKAVVGRLMLGHPCRCHSIQSKHAGNDSAGHYAIQQASSMQRSIRKITVEG